MQILFCGLYIQSKHILNLNGNRQVPTNLKQMFSSNGMIKGYGSFPRVVVLLQTIIATSDPGHISQSETRQPVLLLQCQAEEGLGAGDWADLGLGGLAEVDGAVERGHMWETAFVLGSGPD